MLFPVRTFHAGPEPDVGPLGGPGPVDLGIGGVDLVEEIVSDGVERIALDLGIGVVAAVDGHGGNVAGDDGALDDDGGGGLGTGVYRYGGSGILSCWAKMPGLAGTMGTPSAVVMVTEPSLCSVRI